MPTQTITIVRPVVFVLPSELDLMAADLDAYRLAELSDEDWEQPFARLTDEQLDELEAERPGEHFSTNPFLY